MAVKFTLYVCFVFYKLSWMRILHATNEMQTVPPTFLALAGFTQEVWQSQHIEQQATMPLCIARPYYEAKCCSTSLPQRLHLFVSSTRMLFWCSIHKWHIHPYIQLLADTKPSSCRHCVQEIHASGWGSMLRRLFAFFVLTQWNASCNSVSGRYLANFKNGDDLSQLVDDLAQE